MATYKKKGTSTLKKSSVKSGKIKKGKGLKGKKKNSQSAWKNSPIIGAVCGLVIIYCLWSTFMSSPSFNFKKDLVCTSCKVQMRLGMDYKIQEPYDCPECDKKTLYSAMNCMDCKKVTPLIPPKLDFTCNDCGHHELSILDPLTTPHACPKCQKNSFYESYECLSCEHVFAFVRPSEEDLKIQLDAAEDPSMFMGDGNSSPCPKCNDPMTQSLNFDVANECIHCQSINMAPITPYVVMKKEMGRKLSAKEQKVYDAWEAKQ